MKLKRTDGKDIPKKKPTTDEMKDKHIEIESSKRNDDKRKEEYNDIAQGYNINEKENKVDKIEIEELYPAPFNNDWNDFNKIDKEKEYELDRSIVDVGLLSHIVVWEINKDDVKDLYVEDVNNPYNFIGNKYMVLAGHSRVNSYKRLYKATGNVKYLEIDAIVKRKLTRLQARYITKITNFASRELTNHEKRRNANFFYRTLEDSGMKGSKIAKKIADDSGEKLRTTQYYIRINNNIIDEFGNMLDNNKITQTSAYKLAGLTKPLQKWFYDEYKDDITDNLLRGLKPSYDRKEQLESLFKVKEYGENTPVIIDVPKDLEKKFRTMASKWISKQTNK